MAMSDETPQDKVEPPCKPAWHKRITQHTWQRSLLLGAMTIGLGIAAMLLMYVSWLLYLPALVVAMGVSMIVTWGLTRSYSNERKLVGWIAMINVVLLFVLGGVRFHTNYLYSRTIDVAVCDSYDVASNDNHHADTQISTDHGKYILEAGVYGDTYYKKPDYDFGKKLKGNRLRLTFHGGGWLGGGPYVTGVQYIGTVVCAN